MMTTPPPPSIAPDAPPADLVGVPPACSCHRAGGEHESLRSLLAVTNKQGGKCLWQLGKLSSTANLALEEAACQLADAAMRWRCRGAPASYMRWKTAVDSNTSLTGTEAASVIPFISTAFGTPGNPKPPAHLCGWVAEFVWYRILLELPDPPGRKLRRAEGPSFHATEPGGDGLAVWEHDGIVDLCFCLWEIKNHTGGSAVSATVGRAYAQLQERATEYLAKLTGEAAAAGAVHGEDVSSLYAQLVDLWVDDSARSAVGIAVATHHDSAPQRCFSTMHQKFPGKVADHQLEGLIAGVGNFVAFSEDVRRRIWIAL